MEVVIANNDEAKNIIDRFDLEKYDFNDNVKGYSDFRFLLDIDFEFKSNSFVIAYDEENLFGLIKLVETTHKNKQMKGISFIDINKEHKRKGISKMLIEYFDKSSDDKYFLSSKPCEEGKLYNIDKVIRKITSKKVVFM